MTGVGGGGGGGGGSADFGLPPFEQAATHRKPPTSNRWFMRRMMARSATPEKPRVLAEDHGLPRC